jgi:hypothetical protein
MKHPVMLCLVLFSLTTLAFASDLEHPAAYFSPLDVAEDYGAPMPEGVNFDVGDLSLTVQYPRRDLLTREEKFIIAGGVDPQSKHRVLPWVNQVLMQCRGYYSKHHTVPTQLTPDIMAENGDITIEEAEQFQLLKNPFTGEWPRCQQQSPSPGDFYCRPLNDAEIRQLSEHNPALKGLYFRGMGPDTDDREVPGKLIDIWYVRVYGQGGRVIYAETNMMWTVRH